MSKKHFIALADALRDTKPSQRDIEMQSGEYNQWKRDRDAIISVCLSFNYNFSASTFVDYIDGECGPSGGAIKKAKAS